MIIIQEQNIKILPRYKVPTKKSTRKKSHEQYIQEASIANPNVEVIGTYVDAKTSILHKCKLCGKEWLTTPSRILQGQGCKECSSKAFGLRIRMSNDDFLRSIEGIKNENIEIIGEYVTSKDKIQCFCKICNEYFYSKPWDIRKGRGHQKCSNKALGVRNRLNPEVFKERIHSINPTILLLEDYVRSDDPILCRCLVCNYEWSAWPMNLKKGIGCPECAEVQRRITQHNYHKEKYNLYIDELPDVRLLEEYIDVNTPILHLCLICNNPWKLDPHHSMTRGCFCPVCYCSKGEKKIREFLETNHIIYKPQKHFDNLVGTGNGLLSYDFYLLNHNTLIEYQGEQHEHPIEYFGGEEQFKIQQEHDKRKREYAKEHNINLLEIWYYDYNNIEETLTNYLNLETVETVIPA